MPIGIATIFAVTQLITGSTATLSPTPTDSLPAAVALAGSIGEGVEEWRAAGLRSFHAMS